MTSSFSNKDIRDLLRRAKAGDTEAFGHLYRVYFVPVVRYLYLRLKDRHEAEDLAQAVFLKAFSAIERFEERGKSPLAYFFTVARNTLTDHWRKRKDISFSDKEDVVTQIPDQRPSPDLLIQQQDDYEAMRRAFEGLTDDQREAVTLKFFGDLSNKEIAAVMEKNEDAVRQLQSRGLKALRRYLETHE